jgi:MraZ protein
MGPFRGTFDYNLDAKNRLTVPAKFRPRLADGAILAKGIDRNVAIWVPEEFDAYVEQALADFHPLSPQATKIQRFFSANSIDVELDGAGRVQMPAFLLEHAGLEKETVVTGARTHLEVWDRAAWAEHNAALTGEVEDITALLGRSGPAGRPASGE